MPEEAVGQQTYFFLGAGFAAVTVAVLVVLLAAVAVRRFFAVVLLAVGFWGWSGAACCVVA